jgi:hypothetical protein
MQYAEQLFRKGSVDVMSTTKYHQSGATPAISTKIFKKGFFKQYGILFALIPFLFLLVWLAFASPETQTASLVSAGACALLSLIPFFQVGALKVEPNKLTIETSKAAGKILPKTPPSPIGELSIHVILMPSKGSYMDAV